MKANEISNPIEENSGVIVIEVLSINEASEIADYSSYKSQIEDQARERSIYSVFEAIIEFADIQDDRYKILLIFFAPSFVTKFESVKRIYSALYFSY